MNEILFDILLIVVIVCASLITNFAIPYLRILTHSLKYEEFLATIQDTVEGVEQLTTEKGQGKAKKARVIAFVTNWLNGKGLEITEEQLSLLIEAAVRTMKKTDKNKEA